MSVCGEKTSGEPLEIEAYAARYSGRTKIIRLLFIAKYLEEGTSKREALSMAYDEIKKGKDVHFLGNVLKQMKGKLKKSDSNEIRAITSGNDKKTLSLQNDVNIRKMFNNTENLLTTYNHLGEHYFAIGSLEAALACYNLILELQTSRENLFQACMSGVLVSMELLLPNHVISFVEKACGFLDDSDHIAVSKLLCALGLAHLRCKRYKLAAHKFWEVHPDIGDTYPEMISPRDVATYGVLCALAGFDELELKERVIHNAKFSFFLDLVPEMKQLTEDFSSSRFAQCMACLRRHRRTFLLDIRLCRYVDHLYARIRRNALIRYAQVYTLQFVTFDLEDIAKVFETTVPELEKELQKLKNYNLRQV